MIETHIDKNRGLATIILKPNNSASWLFNMQFLASITFLSLCISSYFALQGFWLVLPFAGLEIAGLFTCLYIRTRANLHTEIITFDDRHVRIKRGFYQLEESWKYHRIWAKIFVIPAKYRGREKQVFIRSHGKQLELGGFLNKKDKERLIEELKNIVYAVF